MGCLQIPRNQGLKAKEMKGDVSGTSACTALTTLQPYQTPPHHRAFAPAIFSTQLSLPTIHSTLHSNSTSSERLSQVPQAQVWYFIEYLHSICHYLPYFIWLLAVYLPY